MDLAGDQDPIPLVCPFVVELGCLVSIGDIIITV